MSNAHYSPFQDNIKNALRQNDPMYGWRLTHVKDMVIIDNIIYIAYEAGYGATPNFFTHYIAKIENNNGIITTNATWYTDSYPIRKIGTDVNKEYLFVLTLSIAKVYLYDNPSEEITSGSIHTYEFIPHDVYNPPTGSMAIEGTTIYVAAQRPGYINTSVRTYSSINGNESTKYGDNLLNDNIYDISADATYLYVSLVQTGIARFTLSNGVLVKPWTDVFRPQYMKIFGGYLYGSDNNYGVINIIDLSGGTITNSSFGTKNLGARYRPQAFYLNSNDTYMYAYNIDNGYLVKTNSDSLCFHENTKILTNKGYITISDLRKGDLVHTHLHGFVPIHSIGYSKLYNDTMNSRKKSCLYKYSSAQIPELFEDLILTGGHSVLQEKLTDEEVQNTIHSHSDIKTIDGKYRLMSYLDKRSEQYNIEKLHNVWHFALEHSDENAQYGVYANGMLVESASIKCMNGFCYNEPNIIDAGKLLSLESNNASLIV